MQNCKQFRLSFQQNRLQFLQNLQFWRLPKFSCLIGGHMHAGHLQILAHACMYSTFHSICKLDKDSTVKMLQRASGLKETGYHPLVHQTAS